MAGVAGAPSRAHTAVTEDLWTAAEPTDPALALWFAVGTARTGDEAADHRLAEALAQVPGTVLKRVTTVTTRDADGREQRTVTTTAIETLKRKKVPAATLEPPMICRLLLTGTPS